MSVIMEVFSPINKLLSLSGTQIVISGFYTRFISRIMTFIIFCASIASMGLTACLLYDYDRYQLQLIANEISQIGALCFIFIMNKNRRTFEQAFTFVLHDLPMKHQKSLKKWSIIFSVYCTAEILRSSIVSIPLSIHHFAEDYAKMLATICLGFLLPFGSCFNASAIYLFIIKMTYFWEESYFERLFVKLKTTKRHDKDDVQSFLININKERIVMNNMKNKLVDSLSFIPIFWFLHLFLFIAGAVVFAQRSEKSSLIVAILTDGLYIVYQLIIVITIIITVDQVNDLVKKKSQTVVDFFAQDTNYFKIEAGVRDFHYRCNDFQFSVCSLFTLNKKLLLGFLSSLLTFTTLFIQIFDSILPASSATRCTSNIK